MEMIEKRIQEELLTLKSELAKLGKQKKAQQKRLQDIERSMASKNDQVEVLERLGKPVERPSKPPVGRPSDPGSAYNRALNVLSSSGCEMNLDNILSLLRESMDDKKVRSNFRAALSQLVADNKVTRFADEQGQRMWKIPSETPEYEDFDLEESDLPTELLDGA